MKQQENIETARLILRPFNLNDAKAVQRLAGDFAIADTTLLIPHPYEDGMAEEWISTHKPSFDTGEMITYAITLKLNGELIGAIGLGISKKHNNGEIGYWIGKDFWNNGYCKEAVKALVDFAFVNFNLNKIFASCFTRNPASGNVLKHIGMKYEGTLRQHVLKWDKYEDMAYYSILRSEWVEGKNQFTN